MANRGLRPVGPPKKIVSATSLRTENCASYFDEHLMSALGETLRSLAKVLNHEQLGWYLFGAQAVSVCGAPRATQDVDVTVQVSREALPGLVSLLAEAGITNRYPKISAKLLASASVLPLVHSSGMEVDLVIAGSGLEQLALDRAELILIESDLLQHFDAAAREMAIPT